MKGKSEELKPLVYLVQTNGLRVYLLRAFNEVSLLSKKKRGGGDTFLLTGVHRLLISFPVYLNAWKWNSFGESLYKYVFTSAAEWVWKVIC